MQQEQEEDNAQVRKASMKGTHFQSKQLPKTSFSCKDNLNILSNRVGY